MPQTPDPVATMHSMSEEDQALLESMVAADSETSFVIRADVSNDLILRNLYVAARGVVTLEHRKNRLLHVVGQILHVIKNNPSVYSTAGYNSWDQFLKLHVTGALGLGKTTLQSAIRIYETFPTVSPQTVAEIGTVKMNLLAKATSSQQPGHVEMIERAKTMSTSQVIQMVAEKGGLAVGDILRSVVTIPTTKSVSKMWAQFSEDPLIQAYCQTKDPGVILEYMMGECLNEWTNRGQERDIQEAEFEDVPYSPGSVPESANLPA